MTHSVYFWLKPDLTAADRTLFDTELRRLLEIDVIRGSDIGTPAPTPEREGITDHSFSYSLNLEFDSVEDHNVYQDHPGHHRFVDACRHLWQRAIVYDRQ